MNRGARFVWAFIGTSRDAEGADLVGGPSRQPPQVRGSRRRSAQPDGERRLLRPHRLVPERHEARPARGEQPGAARLRRRRRNSRCSNASTSCRRRMLAVAMYLIGGVPWLVWGFCLPTMTLAHATFAINTVNHLFGSRRFDTHRRVAQQRRHGALRGRRRLAQQPSPVSARRAQRLLLVGIRSDLVRRSARWPPSASRGTCSRCPSGSTRKRV